VPHAAFHKMSLISSVQRIAGAARLAMESHDFDFMVQRISIESAVSGYDDLTMLTNGRFMCQ
jgi:hypothetical protein